MNKELTYFFKDLIDDGAWDMPYTNFGNIVKFENNEPKILIPEKEFDIELFNIGLLLLNNSYVSDRKKSVLFDKMEELKIITGNDKIIPFKKGNYFSPKFNSDRTLIPDNNGLLDLATDPIWLEKLTSPEHWSNICKILEISLKKQLQSNIDEGIDNMKIISEWLSSKICVAVAEYFDNVEAPKSTNLPDLIANMNLKSEVKTAKASGNNVSWRGGELSKRNGSFFFFSWTIEDNQIKFFVCYAYILKEDWEKRQKEGYYGPTISANELFNEYNPYVIIGERIVTKNGLNRIKLV